MIKGFIYKVLPMQIPSFWETIKFCCVQADEVESKDLQPYFNELLHSLLNEKSQCFVKLGDDKTLLALSVTRILIDKITGQKSLFIQILYSWKRFEDKEWQEGFNFIKEFAEHEQCKYIYFEPRNPRIWEMAEFLGCQESNRKFIFNIGGV